MLKITLNKKEIRQIDEAVQHFVENKPLFEALAKSLSIHLRENAALSPYIHFMEYRVKEPEHLDYKLKRKALLEKKEGNRPQITKDNLFNCVNDLAGVRILHLHTEQLKEINRIILAIFDEHKYGLVDGPIAICWDIEYEQLLHSFGIRTESRESMYTSVHYVVEANQKTKITAELQVRTLMEEVWAEVSRRVGYPRPADNLGDSTNRASREQLKVLARLTSGCTRLIDSIFRSYEED